MATLRVVSPSLEFPPVLVPLSAASTAAALKRVLAAEHGFPEPALVRLVRAGRLLRDTDAVEGPEVHAVVPRGSVKLATKHFVDAAPPRPAEALVPPPEQQQHPQQQPQEQQQQQQRQHQPPLPELPPPAFVAQPAPARRLNGGLLFRLGVLIMVLAQGGSSERLAFLCAAGFLVYVWRSAGVQLPYGQRWAEGGGGIVAELHDLLVPLFLSLLPTWSTWRYVQGMNRPDAPANPADFAVDDDEEEEEDDQGDDEQGE